jgi:ABC-type uncharacterized transport system permease subunit
MVVVCCLKSLLVLFDVTVSNVWQVLHRAIRLSMVSAVLLPPIPLDSMWWMSTAFDWHCKASQFVDFGHSIVLDVLV